MRKIFIIFLLLRSSVSISLQDRIEHPAFSQYEMFNRFHHPFAMVEASRKSTIRKLRRSRHVQSQRTELRKSFKCLLIDTFLDPYFNGKKVCLFGPKHWNCTLKFFKQILKNIFKYIWKSKRFKLHFVDLILYEILYAYSKSINEL